MVSVLYAASNSSPTGVPLTSEEEQNLTTLFEQLEKLYGHSRDFAELWKSKESDIASFATFAKAAFGNLKFGGLTASGGEFAIRPIRAVTAFASLNPPQYNWEQNLTAGWNTLFNINLGYSGNTPATNLKGNVLLMIFGLLDPAPNSTIEEVDFTVENTKYGIIPLTDVQMVDFAYYDFGGNIFFGINSTGNIRAYTPYSFTTRSRLFGVEAVSATISSAEQ